MYCLACNHVLLMFISFVFKVYMKCSVERYLGKSPKLWNLACNRTRFLTRTRYDPGIHLEPRNVMEFIFICLSSSVTAVCLCGLQALYLMPSSSARCAQFPRAQDKVHFYIKLRELRDHLKGMARPREVEEVGYSFDLGLAKGKNASFYTSSATCHIKHVMD